MKESVTIFFFANNNHLSNVKTLQSIYRQDCDNLNLIVCNDCTYGFQNERLLNNFEAGRPANIQYVYFHENSHPMGEFASQTQFWDRINSEYYLTVHSGEVFTAPDALRSCVNTLRWDKSLAAAVAGVEQWDTRFKKRLSVDKITDDEHHTVLSGADMANLHLDCIRDCMVLYRLPELRSMMLHIGEDVCQISSEIIPYFLENGSRIAIRHIAMCRYSEDSIQDVQIPAPAKLGSDSLRNIEKMLQESAGRQQGGTEPLFNSSVASSPKRKKNIHLILYKLCTLARIKSLALIALLLYIAAALFLSLDSMQTFGLLFMVLACLATVCVMVMVGLNLHYKRNPQRLVAN